MAAKSGSGLVMVREVVPPQVEARRRPVRRLAASCQGDDDPACPIAHPTLTARPTDRGPLVGEMYAEPGMSAGRGILERSARVYWGILRGRASEVGLMRCPSLARRLGT